MQQQGPKPWTVRRSTRNDAAAMAALFNRRCNYLGREGHDTEETLQWHWDQPTHEHLQTDCLVADASGRVIAWAGITEAPEPYLKLLFSLVPDPRLQDCTELWDLLCSEVQSYARAFARLAPERSRTILRTFALLGDSPKREALVRNGFDLARVQNKMRIDLTSPPPTPVWPDGIRLTPFSFERDLAAVVAAYQEAFRDHWGIVELPPESEMEKWREEHRWEGSEFNETLWYMAMDCDEVAGFARWWACIDGDCTRGYLYNFFVRRPWRRRGLGTAILSHAVTDLHQRGYKSAELHVDSGSVTNAPRVYERVGFRVVEQQYICQKEFPKPTDAG